ncbi:hypothetical protein Mpsy_2136 [Methanolobus psychrophilus R15]|nr:hypothetical protein Mpsy_2136 [Methanolobus psychrophilus R15]
MNIFFEFTTISFPFIPIAPTGKITHAAGISLTGYLKESEKKMMRFGFTKKQGN